MRILLLAKIFAKSGVGTHICELTEGLLASGEHEVFLAAGSNEHPDFCAAHGVPFLPLTFSVHPKMLFKNLRILQKFIEENRIDVVHCHHRSCALYLKLLQSRTHTPFVWTNHIGDIPHDLLHRATTFYGSRAICVSTELKRFCTEKLRIPPEKISVVLNGICPENYTFLPSDCAVPRDEKINIVLFARMAPMKGHAFLLDAVAALSAEEKQKIRLIFTGGTEGEYADSVRQKAADAGLADKVVFAGFLKATQVLPFCDLSVLPSRAEGFAISLVEAFLLETPVVCTKVGGWLDIQDYCTGVDYGDVPALTAALAAFLEHGADPSKIARAKAFVLNECTRARMTEKITAIYRDAVAEKKE